MRSVQLAVFALALFSVPSTLPAQFGSLFSQSPKPPEVSIEQLQKLVSEKQQVEEEAVKQRNPKPDPKFVLVDVRASEESNVSMIPGAISKNHFEKNIEQFRDRTVIVYCTIGYRSGLYATNLIEDGFAAKNFKGSILAWCAAEQPLVTPAGKPTNRVHTYSSKYKVPATYKAVW